MRGFKAVLGMALVSALGGIAACSEGSTTNPDLGKTSDLSANVPDMNMAMPKAVYTLSNDATENKIYVYARATDGTLTALNSYSTGGRGTGMPLGSQGSLVYDSTQNLFFAVNAGDNTFSMMQLKTDGSLLLLAKSISYGIKPVSITVSGSYVYVVNAGDATAAGNIAGFQISGTQLMPVASSIRALSTTINNGQGPAQISFAMNGTLLVVTEKMNNKIDTYSVSGGVATGPMVQVSNGNTPYGFGFSATQKLIVSEAANNGANQGSASSYSISPTGVLTSVSSKITSGQTAPCWVTVVGNIAYITNAQTNNISAYSISTEGTLAVLAGGVSGMTGLAPTDEDATDNNDLLYVLNSQDHSFSIFGINTDGTLTKKPDFSGLPTTAVGLVAR